MNGQQSSLKASVGAERWRVPVVCLALAAITFAVFVQTASFGFVNYDDDRYVYDNPVVNQGLTLKGIVWAFTGAHAANWHPLTWLSHMLDCQLYGLNPGGHHLTNVLFHTATVIALFLVLRQMTGALWRSAFVAAVFAIHPLRVESVAWVAERKDVLSGLFFMLTIGAYVRYARQPRSWGRYGLVMLLFAMGLLCKPMLVTLPLVLLLLDYWPLQRVESRRLSGLVMEKLPMVALSAISCAVTLLAQKQALATTVSISVPLRFANALAACVTYLRQMIYPAGLAVFYPFPHDGLSVKVVGLAAILLAGFSAVVMLLRRKQPWLLMGWLWYLVMLLPVVGIMQVGDQAHADRYTYLPQIGIYVAVTWLAAEWQAGRVIFGGLMAGVLAVLMVCAWKQTAYWKDSETLWTHTLDCTTGNYLGQYDLGKTLFRKGQVDEAITHYQAALQIAPGYLEAHGNLGNALLKKGQVDEAITQYQEVLRIKPDDALAHYHLGSALMRKGQVDEAITEYQEVLRIKPDFAPAHFSLGIAFSQKGRMAEAITQYQEALQFDPRNPGIQNNLAWLLATCADASLRNGQKALELAQQASSLIGGENPVVMRTLAAAYAEAGQFPEAVKIVQRALDLAEAQSKMMLAGQLQSDLQLYEAGSPYHGSAQTR